jgi:hypothetical protein
MPYARGLVTHVVLLALDVAPYNAPAWAHLGATAHCRTGAVSASCIRTLPRRPADWNRGALTSRRWLGYCNARHCSRNALGAFARWLDLGVGGLIPWCRTGMHLPSPSRPHARGQHGRVRDPSQTSSKALLKANTVAAPTAHRCGGGIGMSGGSGQARSTCRMPTCAFMSYLKLCIATLDHEIKVSSC